MCMCVFRCFGVHVRMRGSKYSLKNPIKGDMYWFAVLFKAFWDISTDISFNVSANGRKQTNLLPFPPTFSLFLFESLLSSLCVALHPFLASFLNFFFPSSLCCCKVLHFLSNSLLSVLLIPRKLVLKSYQCTGVFFPFWSWTWFIIVYFLPLYMQNPTKKQPKTLKKICSYSTVQSKVTPDFFLFCVQEAWFSFNVVLNNSSPGFLEVSQRFSLDCGCCFIYFHSYSFTWPMNVFFC